MAKVALGAKTATFAFVVWTVAGRRGPLECLVPLLPREFRVGALFVHAYCIVVEGSPLGYDSTTMSNARVFVTKQFVTKQFDKSVYQLLQRLRMEHGDASQWEILQASLIAYGSRPKIEREVFLAEARLAPSDHPAEGWPCRA